MQSHSIIISVDKYNNNIIIIIIIIIKEYFKCRAVTKKLIEHFTEVK